MIISASRRTDIPSFYGEWFLNGLKRGKVYVIHPFNPDRFYEVSLKKEDVDLIVFWTKNPIPFLPYLDEIDRMGYLYYFLFTITPYDKNTEENVLDKEVLLDCFIKMSKRLTKDRMVWRYDPIILSDVFTVSYHIEKFEYMCKRLQGYTDTCVVSFLDLYKNVSHRMQHTSDAYINMEEYRVLMQHFARISAEYQIQITTCCEELDLSDLKIEHSSCIDKKRIEKILKMKVDVKKDLNQRKICGCVESIEVGTYNTCLNGCKYCYALKSDKQAFINYKNHNPESMVLSGNMTEKSIITTRETKSIIRRQLSLFDE